MIELVDFNEIYGKGKGEAKAPAKKTRRSAASKKKAEGAADKQKIHLQQKIKQANNTNHCFLKAPDLIRGFFSLSPFNSLNKVFL